FYSKFGPCMVASTDKGVCNILFGDPENMLIDLHDRWKKAKLIEQDHSLHQPIKKYLTDLKPTSKIKLHLHGTNFQIKVWEALLSIPEGQISTYGEIAKKAGYPRAFQATGGAIGDNPVSYLIPCHRVLKSTGEISGYRWGVERKRAMLLHESLCRVEF